MRREDRARLFLAQIDRLRRFVRILSRDDDVANEALQDVALVVLEHPRGPCDTTSFPFCCRGIARHLAMHRRRDRARFVACVQALEFASLTNAAGATQPLDAAIGGVYIAQDGSFYSGGNYAIVRSTDGINWTQLSGQYAPGLFSQNGSSPIVDTGTTVYVTGSGSNWSAPVSTIQAYKSTAPASGLFTKMNGPTQAAGGLWIKYDPVNRVLYTSNNLSGFWRLQVE